MNDGSSFVLRQLRGRQLALVALAVGFVAMGLASLEVFGDNPFKRDPDKWGRYVVWLCTAFFAAVGAFNFYLFVKNEPVAEFDAIGIRLQGGEVIPWEHIRKAKRFSQTVHGTWPFTQKLRTFVFDVDPQREVDLPFYKVWWRDLNHGYSGASHFISPVATGFSLDYIVSRYNEYAPERLQVD